MRIPALCLLLFLCACTDAETPSPDAGASPDAGPRNCTVEIDVDTGGPYEATCDPATQYCHVNKEGGQNSVACQALPACDAGEVCDCLLAPFSDPIYAGSRCAVGDDGLAELTINCCVD